MERDNALKRAVDVWNQGVLAAHPDVKNVAHLPFQCINVYDASLWRSVRREIITQPVRRQ